MRLSELDQAFEQLRMRANALVQGTLYGVFDQRVNELDHLLHQLQAWTKPGRGGTFEVDIEPYRTVGGAPAFMRERAPILLAAATTLRLARRAQQPVDGPGVPWDSVVPLEAPLQYAGEDIQRIQRVFKYLYSKRAYRKATTGEVWVQSLGDDVLPEQVRTIVQLSKYNADRLWQDLAPLNNAERDLYGALLDMTFHLKHATTGPSWTAIYNSRLIFSKDALQNWNILVPTNTPGDDERYKQDVDFVFFRVEADDDDWRTRFGVDYDDQRRIVFDWQQVLKDGWVTLHDMLAPLGAGNENPRHELRTREDGVLVRYSLPAMDLQRGWIYWKWRHRFPPTDATRDVNILDEVFYGGLIPKGIALTVLRDLREIPPLQREALTHRDDPNYLRWLIRSLFHIEGKYPSQFQFEPVDIERVYPDNPQSALSAAISYAGSTDS